MSSEKLLTTQEVAELFGVKDQRVWQLVREKKLKAVVLGERQYRFNPRSIEEYVANGGNQESEKENNGGNNA